MAIQKLKERHLEIGRMLSEFKKQREIAHILGLSESHISRVVHSPVFCEYMNKFQDEADAAVLETLRRRYQETVERNLSILENTDSTDRQKMKAAGGILGRVS
jgi:hypothetical protein